MELWIRSQDKTILAKVNDLWLNDTAIWMEVPFYENHKKLGLCLCGNNHRLAIYKTKERALEVLDEIQKMLNVGISFNDERYEMADIEVKSKILCNMCRIYEMPKE